MNSTLVSKSCFVNARTIFAIAMTSICVPAFAQTQPTRPSAYPTAATMPSAFATTALSPCYPARGYFNPDSSCYSGTIYPSYSALEPYQFPKRENAKIISRNSDNLSEEEAKQRIEAKGYLNVTALTKDKRGIWRGEAIMQDGRPADVILDLEGNIYSELSHLVIRLKPPASK